MEILISIVIFILLFSTIKSGVLADGEDGVYEEVRVGLVADLGSIEGKILQTSLPLALSDIYHINNRYRTRVSVSTRDSQGDPLLALAAGTDLLETEKVEAIVGAQSLQEAKLLSAVSEKAKVPVISPLVPVSLSLKEYHHFIQLTHDSTSEAKGITKLIHDFDWKSIAFVYEDADNWREGLQILVDHFQDEGIHIHRIASFSNESSLGEEYMMNQLRKLKSSRTAVFVVHMSEVFVSSLFRCAEKLGMMEQGYAWILTARTMNHFHYTDGFAIRSMQGVIGFRSYIPLSEEVESFTSRLRKQMANDGTETKHSSNVIGAWAHDIASILATAVEKIRLRASENVSLNLLETIRQSRFKCLSHGDYIQISGHKFLSGTFEIVNSPVRTGERRIGLWSCDHFYGRRNVTASSANELETIIWPGGSGRIPSHRLLAENTERKKLLRVLVTSNNRFPELVAVHYDPETGVNNASGFCIEFFSTCISPFNYELEFIPYNRSNYDSLAYELSTQRDKYDAAVGDITITSNRSLYVEFTLPYTDMGIGVIERMKKREMWTFFDPLEKSLWLASGAFFILTGIVVWLVERDVNHEFQGSWGHQLGIMLWFGFSTLVFAHREKLEKMSSRFLVIVWVFVVLILTASYSANLTSTKTVSRFQLDGLLTNYASLRSTTTRLITSEDYAQALLNGTISFVVDEIPYLSVFVGHYPGVFNMIDTASNSNGFGFVCASPNLMFQRGSGLAPNVSREIAKLRSSGVLKEIEKRWLRKLDSFTKSPNTDSSENEDASKRLTIQELGGLFIIAGVAHALVLALHLFQTRREILRVLSESRLFTKLQSFSNFLYK
ncbi:hypothetical protein HID58_071003 [Brassica napus]|uniref:Glutamate receptor n=1 Tax=Brassica napus TaxID=3708 RepID=A0ABQ7Z0C4_BRANA|nr:hypothetical protein HID58_071003 [Brassica napus]